MKIVQMDEGGERTETKGIQRVVLISNWRISLSRMWVKVFQTLVGVCRW